MDNRDQEFSEKYAVVFWLLFLLTFSLIFLLAVKKEATDPGFIIRTGEYVYQHLQIPGVSTDLLSRHEHFSVCLPRGAGFGTGGELPDNHSPGSADFRVFQRPAFAAPAGQSRLRAGNLAHFDQVLGPDRVLDPGETGKKR